MRRSAFPTRTSAAPAPEPGMMVGGYRLERVLSARRHVDAVYEATAPGGHLVAVTLLDRSPAAAGGTRRREVLRLARAHASLTHPHLVPVLEVGDRRGQTYFVTQLVRGETLADRLRRGPLDPAEALAILGQVAAALELAASKGLVHRDLRPAAVRLLPGRRVNAIVTDLGITCPAARGCDLLAHGEAVAYRSPEELRGSAPRLRSTVYSLACILFECLTGEPPYQHGRPLLTMHAHLVEPPPRISERGRGLPTELDAVIAEAMSADPRKRPRSPARLVESAGRALGIGARVPVAGDRKRQRGRERASLRERRRARRQAARQPRPVLLTRRRRLSAWVAVALGASAVSGFATGNASLSGGPETRPAAATAQARATAEYLRSADATVDALVRQRARARDELRTARGRRAQAAGAEAMAAAYRTAHEALPESPVMAGSLLRRSLRDAHRAYRELATAARRSDRRAWRSATATAIRSEDAATSALHELRRADTS